MVITLFTCQFMCECVLAYNSKGVKLEKREKARLRLISSTVLPPLYERIRTYRSCASLLWGISLPAPGDGCRWRRMGRLTPHRYRGTAGVGRANKEKISLASFYIEEAWPYYAKNMLNLMMPSITAMNHSVSISEYTSCEMSSMPDVILHAWKQPIGVSLGLRLQNCTTNDAAANEVPFHHLRAVKMRLDLLRPAPKSKTSKDTLQIDILQAQHWIIENQIHVLQ